MKYRCLYLILSFAIFFLSCTREQLPQQDENPIAKESKALVEGEAVVLFSDEMIGLIEGDLNEGKVVTKSSDLNNAAEFMGIKSMTRLFPHAGEFEERTRAAGLHKWYKVIYDKKTSISKACEDLTAVSGIELVEPVRKVKSTAIFNDPKLSLQWHYKNTGELDSSHKAGADINVTPVWENYTTGSEKVIVAVVDTGIDKDHEDLAGAYAGGYNFVTNTTKVSPGEHGTHVAGTIAAINNNGKGVSGVAGGNAKAGIKGVRVLSCQMLDVDPNDPNKSLGGDEAAAIKWGADNGAVISQNSWGFVYEKVEDARKDNIPAHHAAAIDYFIANAGLDKNGNQVGPMKGGVVIFASGNDGWDANPICEYEPVISVGAIAPDFTRAYYSNYGPWVDIAAPGGSAEYANGQIISTVAGNKYAGLQGTSMACPHVSGVAALVVSHFGGPGFTNETLKSKLINGANKNVLPKNSQIGPLVDALGAITYGGTKPPQKVAEYEATAVSNTLSFTFKVTSDPDDRKAYGYLALAAKDPSKLQGLNFKNLPEGVVSSAAYVGELDVDDQFTMSLTGLEFEQEYSVALAAFDYNGNYSGLSSVKTIKTLPNNAPVVTTDYTGNYKVKSHETLRVKFAISEPDGHTYKVELVPGSKALSGQADQDGSYNITVVGNADEPGTYKAELKATDQYGLATVMEINYQLLENQAPVIIKDIDDIMMTAMGEKLSINMDNHLSDPDGEQLKYTINISNKTILHINPKDNILHATALSYGLTDVSIIAEDSRGLQCILTFKVLVKDPSEPFKAYPNPVVDFLNISTMEIVPTNMKIYSTTGQLLFNETQEVGALQPAKIDMTGFAPGTYNLCVSFEGTEYKQTIIKL